MSDRHGDDELDHDRSQKCNTPPAIFGSSMDIRVLAPSRSMQRILCVPLYMQKLSHILTNRENAWIVARSSIPQDKFIALRHFCFYLLQVFSNGPALEAFLLFIVAYIEAVFHHGLVMRSFVGVRSNFKVFSLRAV